MHDTTLPNGKTQPRNSTEQPGPGERRHAKTHTRKADEKEPRANQRPRRRKRPCGQPRRSRRAAGYSTREGNQANKSRAGHAKRTRAAGGPQGRGAVSTQDQDNAQQNPWIKPGDKAPRKKPSDKVQGSEGRTGHSKRTNGGGKQKDGRVGGARTDKTGRGATQEHHTRGNEGGQADGKRRGRGQTKPNTGEEHREAE